MSAKINGSGPSGSVDSLFEGTSFWLSRHVPSRKHFETQIKRHGGQVLVKEKDADVKIVDDLKKPAQPGTYSYRFIDDSIRKRELQDLQRYAMVLRKSTDEEPSRPYRATTKLRMEFTEEDDRTLIDWVKRWDGYKGPKSQVYRASGNRLYQLLEQQNPRHTWQSWRTRWVKKLSLLRDIDRLDTRRTNAQPSTSVAKRPPSILSAHDDATATNTSGQINASRTLRPNDFTSAEFAALLERAPGFVGLDDETLNEKLEAFIGSGNDRHTFDEWKQFFNDQVRPFYRQMMGKTKRLRRSSPYIEIPRKRAKHSPTRFGSSKGSSSHLRRKKAKNSNDGDSQDEIESISSADDLNFESISTVRKGSLKQRSSTTTTIKGGSLSKPEPQVRQTTKQPTPSLFLPEKYSTLFTSPTPSSDDSFERLITRPAKKDALSEDDSGPEIPPTPSPQKPKSRSSTVESDHTQDKYSFHSGGLQLPTISPLLALDLAPEPEPDDVPEVDFLDIPPPPGGWGLEPSSRSSSNDTLSNTSSPTPATSRSDNAQHVVSPPHMIVVLSSPEPLSGSSSPQPQPTTSSSDSTYVLPSSGSPASSSLAEPSPIPSSLEPQQPDINEFIDSLINQGYAESDITQTLCRTSMNFALTVQILEMQQQGEEVENMPGVWTEAEDEDIQGGNSRAIEALIEKHGQDMVDERIKYLSKLDVMQKMNI